MTVKLLTAAAIVLFAANASAGSIWVQGYGSYGTFSMNDLNRRVAEYNTRNDSGLDEINAGPGFGVALGRDLESAAGSIGLAFETLDGSSSASHGEYNIEVKTPAYAIRLFLKGNAPWLASETFTLGVGGSLGLISASSDVKWRFYHIEPGEPEPTITEIRQSGTFGGTGVYFDWFLNGEKRLGDRLAMVLDLGCRANTLSATNIDADAIGGAYSSDYTGFFARFGMKFRLSR